MNNILYKLLYVAVHKNLTKDINVINDFTVHVSQLHFAQLSLSSFKQSIQNNQATMLTTVYNVKYILVIKLTVEMLSSAV